MENSFYINSFTSIEGIFIESTLHERHKGFQMYPLPIDRLVLQSVIAHSLWKLDSLKEKNLIGQFDFTANWRQTERFFFFFFACFSQLATCHFSKK